MKTTIRPLKHSMNRMFRWFALLIPLGLACFAFAPQARAVCQDACLTNNNTVQGDDALISLTTGTGNTAVGFNALNHNAGGNFNTAVGWQALLANTSTENTAVGAQALTSNTGGQNTAVGAYTLLSNMGGSDNTAVGIHALSSNTSGESNTALGSSALGLNTTAWYNTAVGEQALWNNTTGTSNTATGKNSLYNNNGGYNTANGFDALIWNSTGSNNTATGAYALGGNPVGSTGSNNTADGANALLINTTGFNNSATGFEALRNNTTGKYCTATGQGSLYSNSTGRNNTAHGQNAMRLNTTGSYNVVLGDNAGYNLTTGSYNIDIGNKGTAGEGNTIRIGTVGGTTGQTATYIAGISGATVAGNQTVYIDGTGHLGTIPGSSVRFKDAIQSMGRASEPILSLQPVTFRYKEEFDPKNAPQFGLIAEQVEKVDPDLVVHDANGKPCSVRYDAVNAMLLNEFLKAHRKVQELEANDLQQQSAINALTAMVKEQASQIQKVSAQLELSKSAPKTVSNNY